MILRSLNYEFSFPRPAMVMGILNVTPDSFSDGGHFFSREAAVRRALELVGEGADILDIGGESSRPGAEPVSEIEELRRVLPVLEKLAGQIKVPISIDTMKPTVARAALQSGASIVNNVAANRDDTAMWEVVSEAKAAYVVMHMQGTPKTMQKNPTYADVVSEVGEFFAERMNRLNELGISRDQIILDPGIGFGKTVEDNLQLLAALNSFTKWNRPILLGASRKAFISEVAGATGPAERLAGSLAAACWGVSRGANIIRAHDVAATRQAIKMTEALSKRSANQCLMS